MPHTVLLYLYLGLNERSSLTCLYSFILTATVLDILSYYRIEGGPGSYLLFKRWKKNEFCVNRDFRSIPSHGVSAIQNICFNK